ncbi:sugar transferase [Chthonomonas calidirosea]|uniref:sugar transferase n=1 Tax=Chthonomonas calidirosea TaxID=454171 RepID=UPI001E60546C|nr:sugar transferase [Chthonomonas calidirosea]
MSQNSASPFVTVQEERTDLIENQKSRSYSVRPSYEQEIHRFAKDYVDPRFPCKEVPYARLKRIFDIVVALFALILFSPIMLLAALLIRLTSPGPIIFRQVRVGKGGRYFWCYKFRSMCVDAEQKKQQLLHLNEAKGPVFKMKRDPRVTPVGAILRKLSIDELPQLINVLKGDMSIVGPRPPLPSEVEQYDDYARQRLAVLPGLTCLWQVSGRSNISFERWVELDLLYIETMSFLTDVKILLQTIPAVLTGSGAH